MHEPRALLHVDRDAPPVWLHSDTPYGPILDAAQSEDPDALASVVPGVERDAVVTALRALAVPSDYGTRGTDYVTHAPLPFLGTWSGAGVAEAILSASNLETALPLLDVEAERDAEVDAHEWTTVVRSRTTGWMGTIDGVSVAPFVLLADGTYALSHAWCEAMAIRDALASYPVLDEEDWTEREYEHACDTVRDALRLPDDGTEDPEWLGELAADASAYHGPEVPYSWIVDTATEHYGWTPDDD